MMVVLNGSSQHVDHEIGGTSVVGILNQEIVLELISDHLNDGPTAQEQIVREQHEIIHIASGQAV